MSKIKLTVSLPEATAEYLRSTSNASAAVAEAVEIYRARDLEQRLEEAYRQDAEDSAALNREWETSDAEVPE